MRQWMYWGSDRNVFKERVKSGSPQRALLFFNQDEIIDNSRIAVDNGFTMSEMFNSQKNVTPGNVCSASIDFNLMNDDGMLSGFDFERSFMFMLGVDYWTDREYSLSSKLSGDTKSFFSGYNVTFQITSDGVLKYFGSHDSQKTTAENTAICMVVWRSNETNNPFYVKVYKEINYDSEWDEYSYSGSVYKIVSGDGYADSQVTWVRNITNASLSNYVRDRLLKMESERTCDVYLWYNYCAGVVRTRISDDGTKYYDTRTMYTAVNTFYGKSPSKVLGKTINYSAVDVLSHNDKDASSYINAEWSTSKSIIDIYSDIASRMTGMYITAASMTGWTSLSNITFSQNPFTGLSGYTYRDLLSLIGESVGMSAFVYSVYITASSAGVSYRPYVWFRPFTSNGETISQDEYYTYVCEEYFVEDITQIISKQTENDIGVKYPADATSQTRDALFIVNNPLLAGDDEASIQARLSYAWQRLDGYSGSYKACTVEMFSPLLYQPGDTFLLTDENGKTNRVYIFAMHTTWNGTADCVIESTGDMYRNQEKTLEYKKTIREGGKYHEIIIDLEQTISRISDAETSISTLSQTSSKIQSEVAGIQHENILRGTATLTNIGTGTDDGKWENEAWKTMGTASVVTLVDSPVDFLNKGFSLASSDGYAGQIDIPVKAGTYTISCYARRVSGSYNMIMWFAGLGPTCPLTDSWTKFKQTITVNQDTTYTAAFSVSSGSGSTGGEVQVCGMKLEAGNTATDWCEANSYAFTRISQTAAEIVAQINDELGNYATQTWTSQQISSSISTALGDYSTTQQTAQAITTAIQTNNGNYYTKTETAQQISSSISTALGDYYTKTETAQQISTSIGTALGDYYTKTETAQQISTSIGTALGDYSTTQQTAQAISTAIQTNNGNYYTKTETAQQISSSIGTALGDYSTTQQTAQAISTAIQTNNGNYYTKTETAQQISTAITNNNGNYYTKTETAQQISTAIGNALGDYSTTQQTAQAISAYVTSHAYQLVSGISITASGVDITGGKYVNIESGSAWCRLGYAKAGDRDIGLSLMSRYSIYLTPGGGNRGWVEIAYDLDSAQSQSINLIPQALYESNGVLYNMASSLGANLTTEAWTDGYIENLYYYNAYEQSSRDIKHDIKSLPEYGDVIDRLHPVSYVYNADKTEKKRFGLIHEETVGLIPEICKGMEYDDADKKAIDYVALIPILLKEIQSLRSRVAELETKNGQN